MINILIFFAFGILLTYYWFRKKYTFWKDHGFSFIEPSFPFGNAKGIGFSRHSSAVFKECYDTKKASCVGFYMLSEPSLMVIDPELIKNVLVRDFDHFHDRGMFLNLKDDPLSGHLFSLEGKEWKDLRAKLTPTFTSGKMKTMFDPVNTIADELINFMKSPTTKSTDYEMKELLSQFSTDVIGSIAFGIETHSINNPDSEFRKFGKIVMDPPASDGLKFLFLTAFPNLAKKLHVGLNGKQITEFFLKLVEDTAQYRTENNVERNDVFQLLLKIKNSKDGFKIEEMAAQCFVFFVAVFETSSSTMTFCLFEMAKNLEIQQKLRDEMQENIQKHDGKITYEGVLEMKYLDKVVSETLRKYPIIDMIRKCTKDYKIPDTSLTLPRETLVYISTYGLHHDQEHYPNPSIFDPERFSEEGIKSRHHFTYLPFGEGPRMCIGLRLKLG